MAYFYMDTDGGSDANGGTSWADAKLTLEGLLAVMAAGDTGYVQGAAADTAAVDRTFDIPGTKSNPIKIIGVADGTTNTGASITQADLATSGNLPEIQTTASATMNHGSTQYFGVVYSNIHFNTDNRYGNNNPSSGSLGVWKDCEFTIDNRPFLSWGNCRLYFYNTSFTPTTNLCLFDNPSSCKAFYKNCTFNWDVVNSPASVLRSGHAGRNEYVGCEFLGTTELQAGSGAAPQVKMRNCKVPTGFTVQSTVAPATGGVWEAIGCGDETAIGDGSSIQNYEYVDSYGTVVSETTAVRTGGADDGASGGFSYAMQTHSDATLEGTNACLQSPPLMVWVQGGSRTLTIHIANSSASTDYTEGEVWCEFFTPDSADTAQYDFATVPNLDFHLLDNYTTAIEDDTTSTWGTGANNPQKFSLSVIPGYTGWAYARVYLAKRQTTPDTLYLDPKIEVS